LGIAWQGVCWFTGGLEVTWLCGVDHWIWREGATLLWEIFYPGSELVQGHSNCRLSQGW